MSVLNDRSAYRNMILGGAPVSKASGAITGDPTISLFTVTVGEVMITSFWLKVTTAIAANGGTLALQQNPTTGDTQTLVTATDLGTSDTAVGSIVGMDQGTTAASKFLRGGRHDIMWVITIGAVELVGASSVDGAVTAYCTWVPLTDGALLAAS